MNQEGKILEQPAITSIPNSLREQLQRVQLLLNQSEHAHALGRDDITFTRATQAINIITTLINRSAEGGTLAVLADMGVQGYEFGTVEQVDSYTVLERRAFGLSFGQFVVPTRTVTRRDSRGRVF